MPKKSEWLKETKVRRDRIVRQIEILQRRLDAFNLILSEDSQKLPRNDRGIIPQRIGRPGSLVEKVWDVVKDDQGNFGVKEIRSKLEGQGRNVRSTLISAALKQLIKKGKAVEVSKGKNRWNPAKYSVNRKQVKGGEPG